MHAFMYATDKIKEEKCKSPTIQHKFNDQIQWRTNNANRLYPCPDGLTGACDTGHCHVLTSELCGNLSQLPWNKDDGSKIPQCATGATGPGCISKPYLEWNTINATGICIFGNFPLRKWCEYPHSRRKGANVKGVTDVPPFKYYPDVSLCTETDAYCDWMEVDFHSDYNYPDTLPTCYLGEFQKIMEQWFVGKTIFRGIKKYVAPEFYEGPQTVEQAAQARHDTEEKYEAPRVHPDDEKYEVPGLNMFNKLPLSGSRLCDERYMKKKKLIGKDFAGDGVHLYTIIWKDEAIRMDPMLKDTTTGFISSELKRAYPGMVVEKTVGKRKGRFYNISKNDAKINNHLKRIYLLTFTGNWMLKNLTGMLKSIRDAINSRRRS
jgi:hypothetical protein